MHPRIEAVLTTDEEVGMEGATAIDLRIVFLAAIDIRQLERDLAMDLLQCDPQQFDGI